MPRLENMRILIAEDQSLVRQGLCALIEHDVAEIIESDNGEDALHLLKTQPFDIALIDIGLPRRTGLDILREVRARNIDVKVIILTGDTHTHAPADIYAVGADGFLYKTADAAHFLDMFSAVARGARVKSPENEAGENAKEVASLRQSLTDRELQIVKLVVEGNSNKDVADTLCISEHTVRKHREHVNRKLSIRSPMALATFAIKAGLV